MGRKDGETVPAICLSGLSIQKSHAIFARDGETVILRPGVVGAKTKVCLSFTSQNYLPIASIQ